MSVLTSTTSSSTSSCSSASSSPLMDDPARIVRFDSECVLIPEHSRKRSRVITKSVALPLWKRRSPHQLSDTESADDPASPVTPTAPEDKQIVIKVPIPSFIVKAPRSPSPSTRGQPLSPCLVHRTPSSPSTPSRVLRRTSLPVYDHHHHHHQRKDESIVTVPLRACCPDCVPITEECMREGDHWEVRFTRGARRRRTTSLDHNSTRPARSVDGPVVVVPSSNAAGTSGPSSLARFAIAVDEVDKRRRSFEHPDEHDIIRHRGSPLNSDEEFTHPRSSSQESSDSSSSLAPPCIAARILARSSPIQEEDEDQLFPLPSPRRTPSVSPSSSLNIDPSPKVSPSHSRSSSRLPTPAASPNASTACIHSIPAKLGSQADATILITAPITRLHRKREEPSEDSLLVPEPPNQAKRGSPPRTHAKTPSSPDPSSFKTGLATPSSSPVIPSTTLSKKGKRSSFVPFLRAGAEALKGAGVDVLKGVGSMNGMNALG